MLPLLYSILAADSDVAALVDDRIYRHGEAPEAVMAPYVTWFVIIGSPENNLPQMPPIDRYEVQVDCWSENEGDGDAEVEELALAVRTAIEAADHHCTGLVVNGKDPETKRYRIGMTFTLYHHR